MVEFLRPGVTCWRKDTAPRVRFLVDCQDYFRTLKSALKRARSSIYFLGWSFDPRTRLTPDEPADPAPIGRLLIELADARPDLDVRLLIWRSALPISATQSFFPHRAKGWFKDSRVRFELDDTVPFGACHHQKVVVIDDRVAFIGGADFGSDRWDSTQHLDDQIYRRTAGGHACVARHEVMALTDGPLAASLGEHFRTRWRTAVGAISAPPSPEGDDPWPPEAAPDIEEAPAAIARTAPAWRKDPEVREIEALTLEAVAAARRLIYLENQYFTWPLMVEALAARLAEPDGPEVVLVCTLRSPSYFDQATMDRARSTAIWRLNASDVFRRFHPLAPRTDAGRLIIAHAKVMVIDDRLARISSANINNRSHGFDTEAELAIEATTEAHRNALDHLRNRLAGHWIGHPGEEVAEMTRLTGGFAEGLWALDGGKRLRPLTPRRLGLVGEFIADFHIGDPTDPVDSWRPWARRRKLIEEARRVRAELAATPPPASGAG